MRALLIPTLIVAVLGSTSVVAGGPTTLGYANNGNIEPVLVDVNAHGRVTDFTPAYRLSPKLMRLLRANLNEMIHTPATDKNGRPVSTEFVINVALQADPRSTGGYDASFAYVSANPVPPGKWFWARDTTGQLGLSSALLPSILTGPIGFDGPPANTMASMASAPSTGGGGGHSR